MRVAGRGEPVDVGGLAVTSQREGDREDEEADRGPDGDHPDRADDHDRQVGLGVLELVLLEHRRPEPGPDLQHDRGGGEVQDRTARAASTPARSR